MKPHHFEGSQCIEVKRVLIEEDQQHVLRTILADLHPRMPRTWLLFFCPYLSILFPQRSSLSVYPHSLKDLDKVLFLGEFIFIVKMKEINKKRKNLEKTFYHRKIVFNTIGCDRSNLEMWELVNNKEKSINGIQNLFTSVSSLLRSQPIVLKTIFR